MPRRNVRRFVLEVLFLAGVAAALTVADLRPAAVIGLMAAAWVVVALLEWAAWLGEPHYGRGLPPRYYVPQVALPPPQAGRAVSRRLSGARRPRRRADLRRLDDRVGGRARRLAGGGAGRRAGGDGGLRARGSGRAAAAADSRAGDRRRGLLRAGGRGGRLRRPEPEPEPAPVAAIADAVIGAAIVEGGRCRRLSSRVQRRSPSRSPSRPGRALAPAAAAVDRSPPGRSTRRARAAAVSGGGAWRTWPRSRCRTAHRPTACFRAACRPGTAGAPGARPAAARPRRDHRARDRGLPRRDDEARAQGRRCPAAAGRLLHGARCDRERQGRGQDDRLRSARRRRGRSGSRAPCFRAASGST